jgi:diguanylate cyclase (GGDEF)-like protein
VRQVWIVLGACAALALPTAIDPSGRLAWATYLTGEVVIVAALWWSASRSSGDARTGWRLVAAAASCWLVGDVVQRVLEAIGRAPDTVGPADVFWLASYPLLARAVTVMTRGRGLPAGVRREIRLDVTAVTVAAGLGVWKLMILPGLDGGTITPTVVVGLLYPLGDVAIFAMAMTLLMTPGRRGAPGGLLIGCLASTLLIDSLFAVPGLSSVFDPSRLDGALLLVNSFLAAAALHPASGQLAAPVAGTSRVVHLHRWRVVLLGAALVAVTMAAALPTWQYARADRAVLLASAVAVSMTILARFRGVVREREAAEARLAHQASHDQLTGLANRTLLLDRLEHQLHERGGAPADHLVLLYLDLDGFKAVNDRFGHAAGDHVLRTVGDRLRSVTRRGDTVARLGGDEFVVLCLGVAPDAAEALGSKLREVVSAPIELATGEAVAVGASVGVFAASAPADGHPWPAGVEDLLRAADTAMYAAKHGGGGVRTATPA